MSDLSISPPKHINTEYGAFSLYGDGYYQLTNGKGKRLHNLILKPLLDYLDYKYPEIRWVVHHKNGVKTDNRFENLQIMSNEQHTRIHTTGRSLSEKSKKALFKANFGKKKGVFGGRGYYYHKGNNKKNPFRRVWVSFIIYNGNKQGLGYFEDFISASIVHELVRKEIIEVL